jgi:hypothetical protein
MGPARHSGFYPARLFGTTDTGWFYDPSDLSTMFQDAAGTTPAAIGSPVGLMLDKSGRGNHRSQSVALNRPTLLQDENRLNYLAYNGTSTSLSTPAFAWGTDKATVVAGVRKLNDAATGVLVELSTSNTNPGMFFMLAPFGADGANYQFRSRGTAEGAAGVGPIYSAPITNVLTGIGDISGDLATLRVNGTQVAQSTADQGTGNYGTYPAFFGARAGTSLFFNGREYSQFAINRLLTANELAQIERYTAQRTGIGYTEVTWDDTTDIYTQSEVFL